MKILKKNIVCPTCQKNNTWVPENPFRPFCSERCKLIDLGAWADEQHRIPTSDDTSEENNKEDEEEC